MTTEQKVEALSKDFLERDGERFIKIKRTDRLGWENTLPTQGVYSSFITETVNKEELLTKAYVIACNMITVMDAPEKIKINISGGQSYCGPGVINVATNVFDDNKLSVGQQLDVFIGQAVHEGCHLLYTHDNGIMAQAPCEAVRSLTNIIEDERIERVLSDTKPGLVNFVGAAKNYHYDKCFPADAYTLPDHLRLLNAILGYIRYPKSLTPQEMSKFADELLAVKEILTPYPESTRGAYNAALRIYDVIKKWFTDSKKKEEEKKKQKQQNQQQNQNQGQGQDQQEPDENQGQNQGQNQQESGENQNRNQNQQGQQDSEGEQKPDEKDSDKGQDNGGTPDMNTGLEQIANNLKKVAGRQVGECNDENDVSEAVKDSEAAKVVMGISERGITSKDCYIEKSTENKEQYLETYERIKRYIPAVAKSLQVSSTELQFCISGSKSGRLDTNRLVEAYQNVETVYKRQGKVSSSKIAVAILIDESGSMWGPGETAARETAILLNEALARVQNVDLYIYGHTASRRSTTLFTYKEHGLSKRYALGSTDSRAGNHDSIAIREVAARVRKHTAERCLFFIISDGAPNESTELVKKAVEEATRKNFDVLAISIDPYYDPATMYPNNIILSDLSTLAIDLGKIIKKSIKNNTKRSFTI